jgi:hypothetical protein
MALAVWTEPALAHSYLNCLTKKVVIVDAPRGSASSTIEENLGFWIDEAAKTLVLADGTPLTVRRFDDGWISAARGDISYEFDRQNGNLTYASSTTKEGAATIVIGSGRCKIAVGPAGQAGCTGRPTIVEASAMTHRLLALYKLRGSRFTTLPTLGEITGAAIMTGSSGASHARHGRSRPTGFGALRLLRAAHLREGDYRPRPHQLIDRCPSQKQKAGSDRDSKVGDESN